MVNFWTGSTADHGNQDAQPEHQQEGDHHGHGHCLCKQPRRRVQGEERRVRNSRIRPQLISPGERNSGKNLRLWPPRNASGRVQASGEQLLEEICLKFVHLQVSQIPLVGGVQAYFLKVSEKQI